MNRRRFTALSALMLLITSLSFFASRPSAGRRAEGGGEDGAPAGTVRGPRRTLPPYGMTDVNGREIPSEEFSRGRVLLVYMTTSCAPCAEEAKIISRVREADPPGLRVYGVTFDGAAQAATYARELGLKFPVLVDAGSRLARSLDIHYLPSTFLVEDGVITREWRGLTRDKADLEHQLNIR